MLGAKKYQQESKNPLKRVNPEFLTNLTHEFLTPLSIISLNLQIIEKLETAQSVNSSEKRNKYLKNIRKQVTRLNEVVQDSIDLLRLDTLNEQANVLETDLTEMLEALKSSIELCKHRLLFRNHLGDAAALIMTDQRLLRTSIFRLVNHACMTQKTKVPELVLREDKGDIVIEILNHDVKLDLEDFNHIFNPFNRTTELEKIEGMSLALTIIKNRLKLVDARFLVEQLAEGGVKYSIRVLKKD